MEYFNTGFTDKSYFNIVKTMIEGIYGGNFDLKKLKFNFYISSDMNACTSYNKKGDYDSLEINTGAIIEIVALIKTAFAQRNILCKFGNSNEERNAICTGEYIFRNNKHELIFNMHDDIVDSCRKTLSFYVALLAIRFIFTHEVGHITNGHTRLMYDLYMNSKIYMRREKSNNNFQYCLDRRTLEMDADATAATYSIDNILMLYEKEKKNLEDMQISGIENLFELWGFSVACIFLKFELDSKTSYNPKSYYLPNDARYLLTINAAKQTLLSYSRNKLISYTVDVEQYDRAVRNSLLEAEKFFRLYDNDLSFTKSLINNHEKFKFFSEEINNNWDNNLRSRLKKYSKTVLFSEKETEQAIKDMKRKEEAKLRLKKIPKFLKKI